MDELLQQVAELRGMPASLVERSAQARAEKTGTTVEEVLQAWAGEAGKSDDPQTADTETEEVATEAATGAIAEAEGTGPPTDDQSRPAVEAGQSEAVTTDHLVRLAADAKRMPPKLILSSATARAEHSDSSLDEVLAEWAGVDLNELQHQAAAAMDDTQDSTDDTGDTAHDDAPESDADTEPTPVAAAAELAAVAGAMSMDELLAKVAEVKGMPASLAKRSAEARSKKTGEPVEAVLAEWAGVDVDDVSTAPADAPATTPEASPAEATEDEELETDADAADGTKSSRLRRMMPRATTTETKQFLRHVAGIRSGLRQHSY